MANPNVTPPTVVATQPRIYIATSAGARFGMVDAYAFGGVGRRRKG